MSFDEPAHQIPQCENADHGEPGDCFTERNYYGKDELFTVRIEVNGKQELRVVQQMVVGGWDLPKLIPRLYPEENLVDTPTGYTMLRIVQQNRFLL